MNHCLLSQHCSGRVEKRLADLIFMSTQFFMSLIREANYQHKPGGRKKYGGSALLVSSPIITTLW